ncbi:MAG: ATP-dependent DNA helicase DinG [Treponema sp.]|nr:ATP-dependent DNA helicase DinG [Treponema sp.]
MKSKSEDNEEKHEPIPLDPDAIIAALEPGGVISRRLPVYEIRESQLELMRIIVRGFNEDALVAAEAGTGVGKSFAYLLPALGYAADNKERIVISTATITLQEQLYRKDIPLVSSAVKKKIKTVLVKGRGNYLCLRRLQGAREEYFFEKEEREQLENIISWAEGTKTGSRSDLAFMPADGLWSRICSEADNCMGMRCQQKEKCFVMLLRREASEAGVLIVNHHLLFADLAARRDGAGYEGTVVLPPYTRVIIDEAHTVEEAATSFFSKEFSRLGIYRLLGRLHRRRRRRESGLLVRLGSLLPGSKNEDSDDNFIAQTEKSFDKIRKAAESLDRAALELCGYEGAFRLTAKRDGEITDRLSGEFIALRKQLNFLAAFIRELLEQLPEEKDEDPVVWEIRSVLRRLETVGSVCSSFVDYQDNPGDVMWIERRGGGAGNRHDGDPWAVFNVSPVDVAPSLKEALFEPNKTVVCVSATLTTGGAQKDSFDYWKNRSGLNLVTERESLCGIFPSPFPYQSKVLLAVPNEAPLPAEADYGKFVDAAASALSEVSGGSALVLFTSYQALKSAYEAARPVLQRQGIRLLKQGDDDRNRLLSSFLEDEASVLFATDSFWEGVDAPGDTLRLVILCRLPFKSPNDPVFEARCEALEGRGGNAFMELSLPEAVMKFKQGFGRLMRRSSDRGAVVVLDGRLLRKRYGEVFLRSLPETKTCFGSLDSIVRAVEDFLF